MERDVDFPDGEPRTVNVTVPTLEAFLPDGPARTAVVVAPGGGFRMLSMDSEGRWAAEWLRDRGVAAYVLKYRLVDTGSTAEELGASFALLGEAKGGIDPETIAPGVREQAQADAEEAVRIVRRTGVDHVGFLGFSAGGIVTTDVGLSDDPGARPDFVAPIYGAAAPDPVPADAPPLFAMVCADDRLCLDVTMQAFRRWRAARRPAELHVYQEGGHGFGMRKLEKPADTWIERLGDWMRANAWMD